VCGSLHQVPLWIAGFSLDLNTSWAIQKRVHAWITRQNRAEHQNLWQFQEPDIWSRVIGADREDRRCGSSLPPSRLLRREDLTSSLWQFRIASISQSVVGFGRAALVIREGNGQCETHPLVLTS
jgi:hypothetical protein